MSVRVPLSITTDMVRALAINESVCVRPILRQVTDRATGNTTTGERLVMAAVCAGCPVLTACDRFATDQDMTGGFWAGTPRDLDAPANLAGPGWVINPLPGLDTLDTLGGLGGVA